MRKMPDGYELFRAAAGNPVAAAFFLSGRVHFPACSSIESDDYYYLYHPFYK